MVPKIRIRIESACLSPFFESNINPTVTGKIIIIKKRSNLNWDIITWNPSINLLEFTCITSGYTVSPKKTIAMEMPTITIYEINIASFVLVDISDLYVVNSVIKKNGAMYALV